MRCTRNNYKGKFCYVHMSKLQYEANLIMRDARQVTNYKGKFEM